MLVIRNTEPNIKLFGNPLEDHVILKPGMNQVDETVWAKLSEGHKIIAHYVDEGILELLGDKPLNKYPNAKAIKAVKDVYDRALLTEMKASEKRPGVVEAIDAQLESIQVFPKSEK